MIGVEYGPASAEPTANGSTVGGNMYYLVAGPNGPVRGTGFDYQLTYDLSGTGRGSSTCTRRRTRGSARP